MKLNVTARPQRASEPPNVILFDNYFVPGRGAKYCYHRVCVSVCPVTYLTNYSQTSRNFRYMLHVTVARSFSDDSAIRYVLSVVQIQTQRDRPALEALALHTLRLIARQP